MPHVTQGGLLFSFCPPPKIPSQPSFAWLEAQDTSPLLAYNTWASLSSGFQLG